MSVDNRTHLAKLLRKAQSGDEVALQLLCKKLEQFIRGYFWQKFHDNAVVDDLSQETYIRLLKNLPTVREEMKIHSFVAKVALHVTQSYLRQRYRRQEEDIEIHQSSDGKLKSDKLRPEAVDGVTDDSIINSIDLCNALDRLPAKSRDILVMKSRGYNYEEISAETGLSVSGVKMQVKRGLDQLKISLLIVTFLVIDATILMWSL